MLLLPTDDEQKKKILKFLVVVFLQHDLISGGWLFCVQLGCVQDDSVETGVSEL
jgi:hypothetical protein